MAIIGAGFGGIGAAVALRRAGIDDLVIIEGDHGVGGTWRRNTYPGAACDIQSHLYSFSFAPNKSWSRTYARQPEILAYLETVADDFDLRRHLMLGTKVRSVRWNSDTWSWDCQLDRAGQAATLTADVVVCAVPHCDPTVNLYDCYHAVRGGRLEAIWPIEARGRSA